MTVDCRLQKFSSKKIGRVKPFTAGFFVDRMLEDIGPNKEHHSVLCGTTQLDFWKPFTIEIALGFRLHFPVRKKHTNSTFQTLNGG